MEKTSKTRGQPALYIATWPLCEQPEVLPTDRGDPRFATGFPLSDGCRRVRVRGVGRGNLFGHHDLRVAFTRGALRGVRSQPISLQTALGRPLAAFCGGGVIMVLWHGGLGARATSILIVTRTKIRGLGVKKHGRFPKGL